MCTYMCAYKVAKHPFEDLSQPINLPLYLYTICVVIFAMWDYLFHYFIARNMAKQGASDF